MVKHFAFIMILLHCSVTLPGGVPISQKANRIHLVRLLFINVHTQRIWHVAPFIDGPHFVPMHQPLARRERRGNQHSIKKLVFFEKMYHNKNNNRTDRPKHAQFNQPVHQPRKYNHEPRCNNRRNQ